MEKEKKMVEERFYQEVAELLCVPNTYRPQPFAYKTRWNNRGAGNGRFPGFGLIRMFSENCIHVSLSRPMAVNRFFKSTDEVTGFLRQHIEDHNLPM
jgi:hypothetical protein